MTITYLLYFILTIEFLYPALIRYLNFPELPSLLIELIIFFTFTLIYGIKKFNHQIIALLGTQFKLFLIFLFIIIMSAIINSNSLLLFFKAIIEYNLLYIFLFFIIVNSGARERDQIRILKLIYVLIFIQIPVTLIQYLLEVTSTADSISGTLSSTNVGGTGINAVLSGMLISILISHMIIKGVTPVKLILVILGFIPPLVGGARFGFIIIPVAFVSAIFSTLYLTGKIKSDQLVYILATAVIILGAAGFIFEKIVPASKHTEYIGNIEMVTEIDQMLAYDRASKSGRIDTILKIVEDNSKDPLQLFFGTGTASLTKSSALNLGNKKLTIISRSDSAKFLHTLGLTGIIAVLSILITSLITLRKYLALEFSQFMRINALAFIPFTIILIFSFGYTSIWTSQPALIYWVFYGIFIKRYLVLTNAEHFVKMNPLIYSTAKKS